MGLAFTDRIGNTRSVTGEDYKAQQKEATRPVGEDPPAGSPEMKAVIYRSKEKVYGPRNDSGYGEILYHVGDEIPEAEAIRQGIAPAPHTKKQPKAANKKIAAPENKSKEK